MHTKHLSQRDIAGILNWSQSRVAKLLTGRVEMGIEDFGSLCFAVGLSPTEVVRDRGMEFCAELTPTELRALEELRALHKQDRASYDSFMQLLRAKSPLISRYATPPRSQRPRKIVS